MNFFVDSTKQHEKSQRHDWAVQAPDWRTWEEKRRTAAAWTGTGNPEFDAYSPTDKILSQSSEGIGIVSLQLA